MNIQIDTEKKYDVIVENGALDRVGALVQPIIKNGAQAMIVSDTNVFPIYGERLIKSLSAAGFKVSCFVFEAGEAQKQISTAMQIYEALAEKNFACTDFIVTLGGGFVKWGGLFFPIFYNCRNFLHVYAQKYASNVNKMLTRWQFP